MKFLKITLIILLSVYFFSVTLVTSDDLSQDLSRHLKLGEIISQIHRVPHTNLFSYTNRDFPFVNHHWLSEVLFYQLNAFFGLYSLLILKVILLMITLALLFLLAQKEGSFYSALISILFFSPFILERNFIRPEIFGYFFFAIILYLLINFPKSNSLIILIPLIMFLWVNIHISFVFGVLLILCLYIKVWLVDKKNYSKQLSTLVTLGISLIVLIFNPVGIRLVIYPLTIFNNYGYPILENQNVFYLKRMIFNPILNYYFFTMLPIIIIIFWLFIKKRFIHGLLLTILFFLTMLQWRHLPFLYLVLIPTASMAFNDLFQIIRRIWNIQIPLVKTLLELITIPLLIILIFFSTSNFYYRIFDIDHSFGFGFDDPGKKATEFVLKNHLPKNIFNNFDLGGFLIYKLYPSYDLFVDNRPEAYPASFLQNIYIPMHYNQELRQRIFSKYKIKTIFFRHTDGTQWAEIFIRDILQDKNWRLVYFDNQNIILTSEKKFRDLRENKKNMVDLIEKENNYLNLFRLSRVFSFMKEDDLASQSLAKASNLNPSSCQVKKNLYRNYLNQPLLYNQAENLYKNSWYCF